MKMHPVMALASQRAQAETERRQARRSMPFLQRLRSAVREFIVEGPGGQPVAVSTDFKAAEWGRLVMDWVTSGLPFDERLRNSLPLMRRRARDLSDNNTYATAYLSMLSENVLGRGMKLSARVGNTRGTLNTAINTKIETAWKRWAESPVTVDGILSLVEFEEVLIRTLGMDGEVLVRIWMGYDNDWGMALEPVDADMLDENLNRDAGDGKNEIRMGVEVDRFGKPVAYHLRTSKKNLAAKYQRVPAEEIIHLYRHDRVLQTRGVSWMLASMFPLKMLDAYEEAEAVAARISASKMGFFRTQDGSIVGEISGEGGMNKGGFSKLQMDVGPGEFHKLPPGWTFEAWDANHPSTAFPAFTKSMLRKAAVGMKVSYNALASDLEGVNYSSMRSGLLIERDQWRKHQGFWKRRFRDRLYEAWRAQAMLTGALVLPSLDPKQYADHEWISRGWPWVDPEKDGRASATLIGLGLASRTRLAAEQGDDFEEILRDLKREEELAKEYGVTITPATPGQGSPAAGAEDDDEDNGKAKGKGDDGAEAGGKPAGGRLAKQLTNGSHA